MDGWIYLDHGIYVKPIDWEECYVISPDVDRVAFELWKRSINTGEAQLIGSGATPAAVARLIKEKTP